MLLWNLFFYLLVFAPPACTYAIRFVPVYVLLVGMLLLSAAAVRNEETVAEAVYVALLTVCSLGSIVVQVVLFVLKKDIIHGPEHLCKHTHGSTRSKQLTSTT